jgi:serine/threonine protein kinase
MSDTCNPKVEIEPDPPSQTETGSAPPAADRAGRYLLESEIANGGMGCVYRARDPALNRVLAVKILLPRHAGQWELENRFREEAQITGQLQHPGIPPVHECGELGDGRPFFAMKLIKGRTLAELLKNRQSADEELPRFLGIFEQVCQTIAYAHSKGVVHRDLKPSNVMVGAFAEVQVMDWGMAKLLTGSESTDRLFPVSEESAIAPVRTHLFDVESCAEFCSAQNAAQGELFGTLMYMSPEQARGEVELQDERCDVFGLGAILCVILTGKPPHRGAVRSEVLAKAERGDMVDAFARLDSSGADRELIQLARACLAPERSSRPRHAGEVAQAVAAYQAGVADRLRRAEVERAQAEVKSAEAYRRQRLMIALAAALVALVVLAGGSGLWLQNIEARRRLDRELEKASRQAALEKARKDFALDLKLAGELRQQMVWRAAREALDQAARRLDNDAPPELLDQLQEARANANLAEALDSIQVKRLTLVDGRRRVEAADYSKAFADYRLDVLKGDLSEVAQRIRAAPIRDDIVTALYEWARFERDKPENRMRLLAVLSSVDPGELKDRLRALMMMPQPDRKALLSLTEEAKRTPLSPALVVILARMLVDAKENPVGLLQYAQERQPRDFWLNFRLGFDLSRLEKYESAAGYFRLAQSIRPGTPIVPFSLGMTLKNQGDLQGALRAFRQAIEIDGRFGPARYQVGLVLKDLGRLQESIASFREALKTVSRLAPQVHASLGLTLLAAGQFTEARKSLEETLQGKQRLPPGSPLRPVAARQLERCDLLLALEAKLPAILKGKLQPKDARERLELAELCHEHKQLHAAAARFYADAFAASPALVTPKRRYSAAQSAALAGTGHGRDCPPAGKQRAELRTRALDWLRAGLAEQVSEAGKGPAASPAVQEELKRWRADSSFSGVREPESLRRLSGEEGKGWENLWDDVADLLDRTAAKEGRRKKEKGKS